MFSKLNNENGGALIYVLMISLILMIIVPGILSMVSATNIQDVRVLNQKKATVLTVSSIRAFVDSSDTGKKNYLADHYGMTSITQPNGEILDYYQYAVRPGDTEILGNSIPLNDFNKLDESYTAVIASIYGDTNHNGVKDSGEHSFFKKQLSSTVELSSEITPTPILLPLFAGSASVKGKSIPGAIITVKDQNGNIYTSTTDSSGNFSVLLGRTLVVGEIIKVTAKEIGKLESRTASMSVFSKSEEADFPGLVKIIDKDGNVTYQKFQQVYETAEEMVVTSGVGNYVTSDCDKIEEVESCIDLTAGNGLTIEEGVSLTTENNGNIVGISLKTTGGDIIIDNIHLNDFANSSFSHITIESAGDVYMNNAILTATRDITIKAAGNIYANNAVLKNEKNNKQNQGVITLSWKGKLFAEGLSFSDTPIVSNAEICGKLKAGNYINGTNDFGKCQ